MADRDNILAAIIDARRKADSLALRQLHATALGLDLGGDPAAVAEALGEYPPGHELSGYLREPDEGLRRAAVEWAHRLGHTPIGPTTIGLVNWLGHTAVTTRDEIAAMRELVEERDRDIQGITNALSAELWAKAKAKVEADLESARTALAETGTHPVHARAEARDWLVLAKRYAQISRASPARADWLRYARYALTWALAMRDRAIGAL